VEVRLGHGVDQIDADGVVVAGERIASKTVIWTAGVAPSPAGKWLNVETDRAGRVRIQKDLSVPGHPEIFVIGDTAALEQDGKPLPGVAQVAIQQGRYAGKLIRSRITGSKPAAPFRYFDKGNMAVVGRGFAVLQSWKIQMSGLVAWMVWAFVHLQFLATSGLRLSVFLQWIWTFLTGQRGSRLIVDHRASTRKRTAVREAAPAAAGGKGRRLADTGFFGNSNSLSARESSAQLIGRRYERNVSSNPSNETGKIRSRHETPDRSWPWSSAHSRRGVRRMPLRCRHGGRLLSNHLAARPWARSSRVDRCAWLWRAGLGGWSARRYRLPRRLLRLL